MSNRRRVGGCVRVLAAGFVAIGLAPQAQAGLVINATFDSTITSDPNAATIEGTINQAIGIYESLFTDPITVNITFGEMSGGLGESTTEFGQVSYTDYRAALVADAKSANDATALAHLAGGPGNPANGNTTMDVATANLRALGFNVNPPPGQPDSTILLNTSIMNLSRSSIDPNKYDLMAVASHEIDEALGFGSALNGLANSTITVPTGPVWGLDLYRYDQNGNRILTNDINAQSFFSIDGGHTLLVPFNQNSNGDFSDWQPNGTPRVQDAFATAGATPNLGVEITGLDVLGYDIAGVPEPSSVVLAGVVAAGGVGYWLRKRKMREPRTK